MLNYQLYLFDFDGLLVNSEALHCEAYRRALARYGLLFTWDFERFCQSAHMSGEKLKEDLLQEYPQLQSIPWEQFYGVKKGCYERMLEEGVIELMPGVDEFLTKLCERGSKRVIVTNSARRQVELIAREHPIIHTIKEWITREDYRLAKPNPECYQLAIDRFASPQDTIIGFEDSPRGITALQGTFAKPVLIAMRSSPGVAELIEQGVSYFPSFNHILHA